MELKSILCPIDFSKFSVATYQYAQSLAGYYKSRVVALHVIELWKNPFAEYAGYQVDFAKFSTALNEGGEMKLQHFVKEYSGEVEPQTAVLQGNAANCILEFAQKENMEGILMGTHGRRGFDRLVLGSTTDHVIRKAPCPVLVVPNASERQPVSRILYCTNFSNNSERARAYAISLAGEYGAELILFHVGDASDVANAGAIMDDCTRRLDELVSHAERKDLNVKSVVRFGKPYEEIVRYATQEEVSLIIMTARGGDTLDRAVFGSTTYRVVQLGPCPVLAVHTDGEAQGN
jgi:nucleotide-binding universal stress UspA family protein